MTERSVTHATFVIERLYDAPPARVFAAFADPAIKERWFVKSNDWPLSEYDEEFRVDGRGSGRFSPDGTTMITNETIYRDIVPDKRIISAYTMAVGETPISTSLATIELVPEGGGTRLRYTEQGVFLDGKDQPAEREAGCRGLFESLDKELRREPASV